LDWARAIEINHAALSRIVAALVAMLGLASGGAAASLSRPAYRAALSMVRPVEAAVRRLIVIAARGLVVNPSPPRPMPAGLVIAGKGGGCHSFQLFDTRKRFALQPPGSAAATAEPLFRPRPAKPPVPKPEDGAIGATRLSRRLAAVKRALETLPSQARRLARWKARRARMLNPRFRSPLRPGPPPGHRRKAQEEIDFVLRECHGLASDALREDTS
jgi:hypothetical protein